MVVTSGQQPEPEICEVQSNLIFPSPLHQGCAGTRAGVECSDDHPYPVNSIRRGQHSGWQRGWVSTADIGTL